MTDEESPLLSRDDSVPSSSSGGWGSRRRTVLVWVVTATGGALVVLLATTRGSRTTAPSPMTALSASTADTSHKSNGQPNVVFVLADDMGYGSIDKTVSPTLYDLQKNGIQLTKYYTQEICAPTRASLMTGRYPLSLGLTDNDLGADKMDGLPLSETTVAELFQGAGYTTYMFGKWNLGNPTAQYLPTARGFDYYLGYLDAFNSYWSKMSPDKTNFRDFLYADKDCFYKYDGVDMDHYSTHLYQDKAVATIHAHDYDESPLFMYLSFQAVHTPFADVHSTYPDGIPDDYLDSDVLEYIDKTYRGMNQQQYSKALNIMDTAVKSVHKALDKTGQLDNTYILFASDNGGCPPNGGRNYPLRGCKGTLFEGGVHVEAFLYSPLIASSKTGEYSNIFHVSDWFPTMCDLAGISYGHLTNPLDGKSHVDAMLNGGDAPRETLLINYYYSPSLTLKADTYMTGRSMAVINDRYKLMHTYESINALWWENGDKLDEDDNLMVTGGCSITSGVGTGDFTFYLFDLKEDPSETENLFNKNSKYEKIQKALYKAVDSAANQAAYSPSVKQTRAQYVYWKSEDNYIVPWEDPEAGYANYPKLCGKYSLNARSKPSFMSNWKEIYERGTDEQQAVAKKRNKDVGESTDGGSGDHGGVNVGVPEDARSSISTAALLLDPATAYAGATDDAASGSLFTTVKGARMPKPGKTPANMEDGDPNTGLATSGGISSRDIVVAAAEEAEAEAAAEAASAAAVEAEAKAEAAAAAAAAAMLPPDHSMSHWRRLQTNK